jgi:hypothetical protein
MITHLETLMAEIIRQASATNDEQWLKHLNQTRREKVLEKQAKLKRGRLDLPLLELTDFCDKRNIVNKIRQLGSDFDRQLKGIEDLRNKLAHAGEYAADDKGVGVFVQHLKNAEFWIEKLR